MFNILVVHAHGRDLEHVGQTRKTSIDHLFCYERYAPHHRYVYHYVRDPITKALKDLRFHIVIFDTSALWMRWRRPRSEFLKIREKLSFIADWDSVKIAFPQDDFDHSELLDDWLADYRFDVVYSPRRPSEHRALLYPRMSSCGSVIPTLTGFVNDDDIEAIGGFTKPFRERRIDIGYRVTFLPARFGSHGQVKALIAGRVERAAQGHGVVTDISTDSDRVFIGDDWLNFLGDCKFCLASEAGSSLWDPRGDIMDSTAAYADENPDASFSEFEAACFPGEDRKWVFSATSPRILEAALLRCGQILVEGSYLDGLEPWEHYLPIDENCDSAPAVFERMRDVAAMERMIESCHQTVIESKKFRYSTHVSTVLNHAADLVARKGVQGTPTAKFDRLIAFQRKAVLTGRPPISQAAARVRQSLRTLRRRFRSARPD